MTDIKASLITIGDELLIGQVIDTNSAWIARQLNGIGIPVVKRIAVGDVKEDIKAALDEELKHSRLVILTGGLGPTADDITKPFLYEYFNCRPVVNEEVLAHVKELFTRRNRPIQAVNLRQAEVPEGCTVLFNRVGTAPGMWLEKDGAVVISLPGVPFEMMGIMEQEVLPRVKALFSGNTILHRTIITAGEGESIVAERIKDIEESLPAAIRLAYLPSPGIVRLRLSTMGTDEAELTRSVQAAESKLVERLENIVVATEDIPMQHIVGKVLVSRNATVGFAESCTGGYLGHLLTQVPGSGNYFKGSLVTYSNRVKMSLLGVSPEVLAAETAISEKVATKMATEALRILDVDYAVSVTGILSPGGEESEDNPVGTVWMAVAGKEEVKTKRFRFHYDRAVNKEMAAQMALLMLWKFLNGKL